MGEAPYEGEEVRGRDCSFGSLRRGTPRRGERRPFFAHDHGKKPNAAPNPSLQRSPPSAVVDLFQGQLKCTLTCASCSSTREKFEPFLCLTLPMAADFDAMLSSFEKAETLSGDCAVTCEKCGGRKEHTKTMQLWTMPPVLLVSVKRFDGRSKLKGRVRYPETGLDFERKARGSAAGKSSYDLFGVVRHHGTRSSGHYTALCKSRFGSWWLFDDSRVERHEGLVVDDDAYVLGYCRMVGGEREHARRQSVSLPDLWPGGR